MPGGIPDCPDLQEKAQELEVQEFVRVKDQRLEEVKKAAASDQELLTLGQMIGRGWPSSI